MIRLIVYNVTLHQFERLWTPMIEHTVSVIVSPKDDNLPTIRKHINVFKKPLKGTVEIAKVERVDNVISLVSFIQQNGLSLDE